MESLDTRIGSAVQADADFRVQSEAEVEARFVELERRRAAAARAVTCRHNATVARDVARSFAERARAFHALAQTRGSTIDHVVDEVIAEFCESKVSEFRAAQVEYTTEADRIGSV